MKYCKICGTLLEDTHNTCIRCGADVTIPENVSMFPIEVMKTIEEENQRKKASGKIVAMIIALVVVLTGLVLFFLYGMKGRPITSAPETDEATADVATGAAQVAETEEEVTTAPEPTQEPEATPAPTGKKVKDKKGVYYEYFTEKDDAGNVIFTTLLPEELKTRDFYKDYEGICDRYPFTINFTASNEENDVRFTYLSPRRLWYKVSSKGKTRSDERDITHYRSYFKYEDAKSYLEPLLKQSYPGAKFELKEEYDVSEQTVKMLEDFSKARNDELFGDIGDYGYIGEGTSYAPMDYECSAKVYVYEITLSDKNMLFCKYYIPSMAHHLTYSNSEANDMGDLTEWYNFSIICYETGNEDDYEDYQDAFDIFVANALPTDLFMYLNESYSKDIIKAVSEEKEPEPLTKENLSKYAAEFTSAGKTDDFDTKVMEILRSAGGVRFKGNDITVYSGSKFKVGFYDKDSNKVFLGLEEDQYPGDSFEELTKE